MTEYRRVPHPDFTNNESDDQPRILEKVDAGKPREGDDRPVISNPKICDFIATYLVAFEKQNPDKPLLKDFFNPDNISFRIVGKSAMDGSEGRIPNFLIWRERQAVICGEFDIQESMTGSTFLWKLILETTMESVRRESKWSNPLFACYVTSEAPIGNIWLHNRVANNTVPVVGHQNPEEICRVSQEFGNTLSNQHSVRPELFSEFYVDIFKYCDWSDPRQHVRILHEALGT